MSVYIDAVGIAGPGLNGWTSSLPTLRDEHPYTASDPAPFAPTLLPANEQRRATATVRIAFRVAEEALRDAEPASSLATVFASSDADMMVSHRICSALAQTQRLVSPTDFHNSVHNAPSGYWHIGARSTLPSSAIAGHDHSFTVGLLEAMTQVQIDEQRTLFVCYDVPAPAPLQERRPMSDPFAVALLLVPQRSARSIASIDLADLNSTSVETQASDGLDALRIANPAARSLPLLKALACGASTEVVLRRSADCVAAFRVTKA